MALFGLPESSRFRLLGAWFWMMWTSISILVFLFGGFPFVEVAFQLVRTARRLRLRVQRSVERPGPSLLHEAALGAPAPQIVRKLDNVNRDLLRDEHPHETPEAVGELAC